MRIALAQINTTVGDFEGNVSLIVRYMERARYAGADIVVFPEMAVCGYPPEDLLHKSHFVSRSRKALNALRKHSKDIIAVVGCLDRARAGMVYNAAAVFCDRELAGMYRKQVLPNYSVFDEQRYFTPGEENPIFEFNQTRIGISICEDIWPEEGVHCRQAEAGAQVLVNISCSPYDIDKQEVRRKMLARRARSAGAWICYANLVGGQDELVFDGASCVVDPRGKTVGSARSFAEDLLIFDIDTDKKPSRRKKQQIIPLTLKRGAERRPLDIQRRPPLNRIERIYQALVLGTRDYVVKNGFKKAVIGLSGGIDSALTAMIAVDALGAKNVQGVSMPSPYTSEGTRSDARRLADNLGIAFQEIPVKAVFEGYLKVLKKPFADCPPDETEENLQARIRGNFLMALSNKFGWLVLTTGNKSEMAVGYCTLYGDMSGGFAVLIDIYKTRVYELARYRNSLSEKEHIPQSIIDRAPSAELRADQKDQDSLPPYDLLDRVLIEYIERHASAEQIIRKTGCEDVVKQTIRMVDRAEYKRRQAPPGIRVTPRAFGKDWRLPITNKYRNSS
ncbi:MAG: NAD+ synthase [Candidatus Omnitrophota bacterium]